MKRLYFALILFLSYFCSFGQVIFTQIPRDLQLYTRDGNNQAEVVVSGTMSTTAVAYTKIGLQTLREGIVTKQVSQTVSAANTTFNLSSVIKAEPAEYGFRVFAYKGQDSTLVAERKRVVCGDVYIFHGQSNALALAALDTYYSVNFDDKYLRNVGYIGSTSKMAWYPAKQPYASVGGLGLTIQRLILQTYGIPTCVINGAQGGTAIAALSARNPANHADTTTFYGNLLYRAQWAGVAKLAKAIIWRQGEEDAGTGISGYAGKFATLYNQFREDYGNMRMYVGQINILDATNPNPNDSAAALRDFQRRTKFLFKNVETIATVGTPGYQGVHYEAPAYQRLAFEQFRQIARDIYGSTDTLQINSPDIKKVFYNARKDSITLVFDDQMQMVWKNDTATYSFATGEKIYGREQKDYFYLDGKAGLLAGGSATGNRVILALKQPATAKTLRYLPAYFSDNFSAFYDGPVLKNTRDMRAFSFDGVVIADGLAAVTTLAAKTLSEKQIQLNWTVPVVAQAQILERSDGKAGNYKQIASLNGTAATYTDTNIPDSYSTYYYRLRSVTSTAESDYSNVAVIKSLVLGIEPTEPVVNVYPNPLVADRTLHVEANQVTFTQLLVQDMLGRVVKSWSGIAKNTLSIGLNELEAGLYIATLQSSDGQTLQRKIVIR